jgi:hypothetical protein
MSGRTTAVAYMNFAEYGNETAPIALAEGVGQPPAIDPLIFAAVQLGAHDDLQSLHDDSFWARCKQFLFGLGTAHRLADPVLEAIRRLTVIARLGRSAQLSRQLATARILGVSPVVIGWVLARFDRSSTV